MEKVDLENQSVFLPDGTIYNFDYDVFRKHCLLSGQDDIDYIFSHQDKISSYRKAKEATTFAKIRE